MFAFYSLLMLLTVTDFMILLQTARVDSLQAVDCVSPLGRTFSLARMWTSTVTAQWCDKIVITDIKNISKSAARTVLGAIAGHLPFGL